MRVTGGRGYIGSVPGPCEVASMALARALHRVVPCLLLAVVAAASAGCPSGTPVGVAGSALPATTSSEVSMRGGASEGRVSNTTIFQLIDGTVAAPAALAKGGDR